MKNDRVTTFSGEIEDNLYPHFKITRERFPRLLATRRIEDDGAEYYGPFLPKTSVRILIDFLNRKFKLRTCDLDIDGSFPVPCTMYYRKRCHAPCVASICDGAEYGRWVGLVRLFLEDRRRDLRAAIMTEVETAAADLAFESAAEWRDLLASIERRWENQRLNIWLDNTVDTIATEEVEGGIAVYIVTQRDRYVLGRKVFNLPVSSHDDALYEAIDAFYKVGLPREIRVYREFRDRKNIEAVLSERFGRDVRIKVVRRIDQRVTARRALHGARAESELDRVRRRPNAEEIALELKRLFKLAKVPRRIEAFDVAHISASNFAAANSVWESGRLLSADFGFDLSKEGSELAALAKHVRQTLDRRKIDLILLDGGKPQLNAVVAEIRDPNVTIAAAVKPKGKHSAISHFVRMDGSEVGFDPDNPAHGLLQMLRDEAHDLSNRVHRDLRDMGHYYELAALLPSSTEAERREIIAKAGTIRTLVELSEAEIRDTFGRGVADRVLRDLSTDPRRLTPDVRPLIVPIRFVAEDGNADDLIPIESR